MDDHTAAGTPAPWPPPTYRTDLSEHETWSLAAVRDFEERAGALIAQLAQVEGVDPVMLERATLDLASGCMFATRAVARPRTALAWPPPGAPGGTARN